MQEVKRHELKFYISRSDYEYSRKILSELMSKDSNQKNDRGYMIRSLYFDDVAESAVEEKLDGIECRDKYRIRIYDTKQNWAKLERKRKHNNYVDKSSVKLSKLEVQQMLTGDYEFLLEKPTSSAQSIYFDLKRKYFRPVVIVDYIRDVFMLDYNDIRITFDKHIRVNTSSFDVFEEDLPTQPLQRADTIIMEVKFNSCLPSWFKSFIKFDSAISMAISKYCHGRMQTKEFYTY